jgi:hypothetical protein
MTYETLPIHLLWFIFSVLFAFPLGFLFGIKNANTAIEEERKKNEHLQLENENLRLRLIEKADKELSEKAKVGKEVAR